MIVDVRTPNQSTQWRGHSQPPRRIQRRWPPTTERVPLVGPATTERLPLVGSSRCPFWILGASQTWRLTPQLQVGWRNRGSSSEGRSLYLKNSSSDENTRIGQKWIPWNSITRL